MPTSPLPIATSLDEVYTPGSLLHQGERWDQLAQTFEKEYGVKPQKVARAPGRVNVIGELPLQPSSRSGAGERSELSSSSS